MCRNMRQIISAKIYTPLGPLLIYLHLGKARFLHLGTVDILGHISLCEEHCPVLCRIFSSIADLDSLDDSGTLPSHHL
jgi:hypothetical protein